jgi:hypothetical protein
VEIAELPEMEKAADRPRMASRELGQSKGERQFWGIADQSESREESDRSEEEEVAIRKSGRKTGGGAGVGGMKTKGMVGVGRSGLSKSSSASSA